MRSALVMVLALAFPAVAVAAPNDTRVSSRSSGEGPPNASHPQGETCPFCQARAALPSISADGRFVAFWSAADNLVPGITQDGVYVRDHGADPPTTTLVSRAGDTPGGEPGRPAQDAFHPSMSRDGRYVLFSSKDPTLAPGDTGSGADLFVRDRQLGTTTLVSRASGDGTPANGESRRGSISADGRYIAFLSKASNLVPGDTNGKYDVFVRDRKGTATTEDDTTVVISRPSGDGPPARGLDPDPAPWVRPSISANGRYVAFYFRNTQPGAPEGGDLGTGHAEGIFMRDLQTRTTAFVTPAYPGSPSLSADGRLVAFRGEVEVGGFPQSGVFVRDLGRPQSDSNPRHLAFDNGSGQCPAQVGNSGCQSSDPSISPNGRFVAFVKEKKVVDTPQSSEAHFQIFVNELHVEGGTTLVSRSSPPSAEGNADSHSPTVADSGFAAFASRADNLVPPDTNGLTDIFRHELATSSLPSPTDPVDDEEPASSVGPSAGSWAPTGRLQDQTRRDHSATALADGRVLVVGGSNQSNEAVGSAELYDPVSEKWELTADPAGYRKLHSATLIAGGKVLVAGGVGGGQEPQPLSSAEVYDPGNGWNEPPSWTDVADGLVARSGHSATPLPDGKVLLVGGVGADGKALSSAQIYEPGGGFRNAPGMSVARSAHSATAIAGGKVLIAGGIGADGQPLSSAEVYDPSDGSFTAAGDDMKVARSAQGAAAIAGGKVLLTGGVGANGALASAEIFDPAAGFSDVPTRMSVARSAHTATTLLDGRVLVAGGRGADNNELSSTEVFDPATGTWSAGTFATRLFTAPSEAVARFGHTATLLANGKVLVAGNGNDSLRNPPAELFDPNTPSHFSRSGTRLGRTGDAVLLTGPACRTASPASYCGKLLGAGSGLISELYDPVTNTWSGCKRAEAGCDGSPDKPGNLSVDVERTGATLTLLDGPECHSGAVRSYCGKVLLVGGTSGGGLQTEPYARVELYDPAKGTWRSCELGPAGPAPGPDCPAPFRGGAVSAHSATLLPDGRVLIAGGSGGTVTQDGARRDFYIYDPGTGTWGPAGALSSLRLNPEAVLLQGGAEQCGDNCGKVLLVGGDVVFQAKTAELIDPVTRQSAPTPALVQRRIDHSATLLASGHVVVVGGSGSSDGRSSSDTAEFFDPKAGPTGAWGPLVSPRADRASHTATLLPTGRLLLAGGTHTNAAELYDPAGTRSVFTDQGPAQPRSAALLPSGPLSLCATSCGKVALTDTYESAAVGWVYTPRPEVADIAPASGSVAGGTAVALEGRGLASVASVRFGALEATSVTPDPVSPDTRLVAISPPQPAGTVPVTATSSGGTSRIRNSAQFTYTTDAAGGGGGEPGGAPPPTGPTSGVPATPTTQAPTTPTTQAPTVTTTPAPGGGATTFTAKVSLARARIYRRDRVLDVFAPISARASGRVNVQLHAAGRRYRFTAPINSQDGRIRFRQRIPKAQADLGTGIVTLTYRGDADTRPQTVRLRAASRIADLRLSRPTLTDNGRLRAAGTIADRARGVVRVQLEYVVDRKTTTLQFKAPISDGRWSLNEQLSPAVRRAIAKRTGTLHSYTLFTGYMQARMRGEMRSFQVGRGAGDGAAGGGTSVPGPVQGLTASARSSSEVLLSFLAAGSNGTSPPPARRYVVKQSLRPITSASDFTAAQTLCGNTGCDFEPGAVGERLTLTVDDLRAKTTYYYAVAARSNSGRQGPRSSTVRVTTK